MPRGNKSGGKKHKRGKKTNLETKVLRYKEEGQEYAQVTSLKGNCRFDVKCFDGTDRMAILCGSMRKRKYINMMDIVLVSLRDFQDSKCDIIDVYDDNQVRELKKLKEIPDSIKLEETTMFDEDGMDDIFDTSLPPDELEDELEEELEDINLDDI